MVALPLTKSVTAQAIETAREAERSERDGFRISASKLGLPCDRAMWYDLRWVTHPTKFDGRMLRLFETGHMQEARLLDDLRRIGCSVVEHADNDDEKQIGISFADGHGYGYLDAEAVGIPEAPVAVHVVECKSHSEKSFNRVKAAGVKTAKPEHYAQTMIYMHKRSRSRGLYLYVNKNTDEVASERFPYNAAEAMRMEARATRIAHATKPPDKLHPDPDARAAFVCRFCDHLPVCHEAAEPRRTCRSCIFIAPGSNGEWWCGKHSKQLKAIGEKGDDDFVHARDVQGKGCLDHLFIPELVSGDQIDSDIEAGWIDYAMPDGSTWRDGVAS